MAEVEIGVNLRKLFVWLEELAKSDIEALQREVSECYRNPPVERTDAATVGTLYRAAENKLDTALTERDEVRHQMLNHWCQHGITSFPAGPSAPYRIVPRIKLSLDDEEVRELIDEDAWKEVTELVPQVNPKLLLAWAERQGPEMQRKLVWSLYIDCTPEVKPPRETPKSQDRRVIGRTPKRKKKKSAT